MEPSKDSVEWNKRAGKGVDGLTLSEMILKAYQEALRFEEEMREIIDAENDLGILDGLIDTEYVAENLSDIVENISAGKYVISLQEGVRARLEKFLERYDAEILPKAMGEVLANNDLKLTTDYTVAEEWLRELEYGAPEDPYFIHTQEVDGVAYYSIHNTSENKVIKPKNHPKPNLEVILEEYKK